jgi:hypothetical protein
MNSTNIYRVGTGRVEAPDAEALAKESALKATEASEKQALVTEWFARPMTQQFLSSVLLEANELALTAQDNINTQQIINKLVQSATLRKVIQNAKQSVA